ncbi:hypothetical protein [Candidatus Villigracilis saccharophilus]|uniref:hypothetical protein n=1 Tax=Candidatus Villigracilis saccharophilus TaxID=3140684 RepID=UPI0031EC6472
MALLLLSQQPVSVITLPEAAPGGIYTEALIGSMGRLNPMLDWNNPADRDINRLIFSGLIRFDSRGLASARIWLKRGVLLLMACCTIFRFAPTRSGMTVSLLPVMMSSSQLN